MQRCEVRDLGVVTYENGLQMQETLVRMRQQDQIPDQLLLLEHTPVITLGRGGKPQNLLASEETLKRNGVRFYETTRGGDITYHGPGQLVAYPILHLGEGRRDVRKYVTKLEEVLIRTARDFGVEAARSDGNRGVWVGGRDKLASIGVRIAKWVTSHGIALNVATNLDHFALITPCGIQGAGVTSLQQLAGTQVTLDSVRKSFARHFSGIFERDLQWAAPSMEVVKVVVLDENDRVLLLHRKSSGESPVAEHSNAPVAEHSNARFREIRRTAAKINRTGRPGDAPLAMPRGGELLQRDRALECSATGSVEDQGWWQPVTGRVEPGENHDSAAARETLEETGQQSVPVSLDLTQSFLIDPSFVKEQSAPVFAREQAYAARINSRVPIRLDPEEHDRFGWFTLAEARNKVRWSDDREAIETIESRFRSKIEP